jgi:hypothetical protein
VTLALYLIATGELAVRARAESPVPASHVFSSVSDFLPLQNRVPGCVLLGESCLPPADMLRVIRECGESAGWTPVLLVAADGELEARALVPGAPMSLKSLLATRPEEPEIGMPPMQDVLDRVKQARHAINNPLGAGLAEVQLLLMDAVDEETLRGLTVIQEQLHRIREVVASLRFPGGRGVHPGAERP